MKITIRDQKRTEKTEPTMELWLSRNHNFGGVELKATDASGHTWTLLNIGESGIELFTGIPLSTGWPISEIGDWGTGKIKSYKLT